MRDALSSLKSQKWSFTIPGVFWGLISLLIRVTPGLSAVGLYRFWINPPEPGTTGLTSEHYIKMGAVLVALVVVESAKDYLAKRKREVVDQDRYIFNLVESAIKLDPSDPKEYFKELLRHLERLTVLVYEIDAARSTKISANLMKVRHEITGKGKQAKTSTFLDVTYFGTTHLGREHRAFEVDQNNPGPGAIEAYLKGEWIYTRNTLDPKLQGYFDPKKEYRSIMSIPLKDANQTVFALVNIDSAHADTFGDKRCIEMMKVKARPILALIELNKENL